MSIVCPINPPAHDWDNGLACRWCDTTRTPGEAIVSGLASRRGGNEMAARALLAERDAEVIRTAVDSISAVHQDCRRDRDVCAGCQVRADILDVLRSVAEVIAR